MERAIPPADISPENFFTQWVPDAVARDADRRRRLGETEATIVFDLEGQGDEAGGLFTLRISQGRIQGAAGDDPGANLRVRLGVGTWRRLNSGEASAPQALLKRHLRIEGDFLLGLKLHLILG